MRRSGPGFEDSGQRERNQQTKADDINHNIILHISDRAKSSKSALAALKQAGYEIVSTNDPTRSRRPALHHPFSRRRRARQPGERTRLL
jgi:hypothetical protein